MLFSILLPTRDRLEYLRHAVESVLRQDEQDWEIVVSDNASGDDIEGFVASLGDERIRYVATGRPVAVTENWNNALRHSLGDYVVMLGDDDALLPGYLSAMRSHIVRLQRPDAIYTGAYLYAYPGVLPDAPEGFLAPNLHAAFLTEDRAVRMLDPERTRELARAATRFEALYDFNMQYTVVSRRTIDELRREGDFYRSPFPDYFAMNLLFAECDRIAVDPRPWVVIGITRRSYGYFHFNRRDSDAQALLATDGVDPEIRRDLAPVLLPGTNINTSWLLAMEALYRHLGRADMRPDYGRYRRLQAIYCEQAYHLHGTITRIELRDAEAGLPPRLRRPVRVLAPLLGGALRVTPMPLRRSGGRVFDRLVGQYGKPAAPARETGYADVIAVLDHFDERSVTSAVAL